MSKWSIVKLVILIIMLLAGSVMMTYIMTDLDNRGEENMYKAEIEIAEKNESIALSKQIETQKLLDEALLKIKELEAFNESDIKESDYTSLKNAYTKLEASNNELKAQLEVALDLIEAYKAVIQSYKEAETIGY